LKLKWQADVDLLKPDVQGAELLVLRGAEQTLPHVRFVFREVDDFLCARGFRLLSLREGFRGTDGELFEGDALFVR
jgi:hypothetical protein